MEERSFKIVSMRGLRDEVIADLQSGVPEALFVYSDAHLSCVTAREALGVKITRDVRQSRRYA
jgi:hypothetical protein